MPIRHSYNKRVRHITRKTYKTTENWFIFGLKNCQVPVIRTEAKRMINSQRIRNNEIFRKMKSK